MSQRSARVWPKQGYVEGRNVAIEYRWAEGQYDRLPAMAGELVRRPVTVIVATPIPAAVAAKAATATIPIVFNVAGDPVRLGLVASLARPGGNATGVNSFQAELGAKQLGLLRELLPTAVRIGLLVNPTNANVEGVTRDVREAASAIGVQIDIVQASDSRQIEDAFATLVRNRADALVVGSDAYFVSRRLQLATLATQSCDPRRLQCSRVSGSWRPDELRNEPDGSVSAAWRLLRPHSQRRMTTLPSASMPST